jgi:hypothetical protein
LYTLEHEKVGAGLEKSGLRVLLLYIVMGCWLYMRVTEGEAWAREGGASMLRMSRRRAVVRGDGGVWAIWVEIDLRLFCML